jgi:hypothetical protein
MAEMCQFAFNKTKTYLIAYYSKVYWQRNYQHL